MDDNSKKGMQQQNEGEGSRSGDKSYREGATAFARGNDSLKKGLEAERQVEMYKDEFDTAEKAGRSHSAGDLRSDLNDFGKGGKK